MIPGWIKFGDLMYRIENPRAGAEPTTTDAHPRGALGRVKVAGRTGGSIPPTGASDAMRALAEQMKRIG